jgi:hypothetical protein
MTTVDVQTDDLNDAGRFSSVCGQYRVLSVYAKMRETWKNVSRRPATWMRLRRKRMKSD